MRKTVKSVYVFRHKREPISPIKIICDYRKEALELFAFIHSKQWTDLSFDYDCFMLFRIENNSGVYKVLKS